jgi:RHS repeat-associated protein
MKLNKRLQKSLSYILLPVMVLFTFQSAFANNYECQITNYDKQRSVNCGQPHSLTINNSQLTINDNPFKYSGYYSDSESGLYYLKARYYSPELMRFINRDTYDLSNRYAYCNGNPISSTDTSGHKGMPWEGWNIALTVCSFIPVVGNIAAIAHGAATKNWVEMGLGIGFLCLESGAGLAYRNAKNAKNALQRVADSYIEDGAAAGGGAKEGIELTEAVDFNSMTKEEIKNHLMKYGKLLGRGAEGEVYGLEGSAYKIYHAEGGWGDEETFAERDARVSSGLTRHRRLGYLVRVIGRDRNVLLSPIVKMGTTKPELEDMLKEVLLSDRRVLVDSEEDNCGRYGELGERVVVDPGLLVGVRPGSPASIAVSNFSKPEIEAAMVRALGGPKE